MFCSDHRAPVRSRRGGMHRHRSDVDELIIHESYDDTALPWHELLVRTTVPKRSESSSISQRHSAIECRNKVPACMLQVRHCHQRCVRFQLACGRPELCLGNHWRCSVENGVCFGVSLSHADVLRLLVGKTCSHEGVCTQDKITSEKRDLRDDLSPSDSRSCSSSWSLAVLPACREANVKDR